MQGDVDGAVRAIQEFGGRVSPRALSEARRAVTAARTKASQEKLRVDVEQRGIEDAQGMAAALGGGATPDEAGLLTGGWRAGGNAFLDAARAVNRNRMTEQGKQRKQASALSRFLKGFKGEGAINPLTNRFHKFPKQDQGPDPALVEAVRPGFVGVVVVVGAAPRKGWWALWWIRPGLRWISILRQSEKWPTARLRPSLRHS